MEELFFRIFLGGMFVGALTGIAIMCVIALIALKIEDYKGD